MTFENRLDGEWFEALISHGRTPIYKSDGSSFFPIGHRSINSVVELRSRNSTPLPDIGHMIESGKSVHFWSDPHFDHANIIHMTNRSRFFDVVEMNHILMSNVVSIASTSDMVVCLGDLALKKPLMRHEMLRDACSDKHVLVVGNHDLKSEIAKNWSHAGAFPSLAFSLPTDFVHNWMVEDQKDGVESISWKKLPERINFGCSHWPVPTRHMPGFNWVNLHGHIHEKRTGRRQINCSVEAIDYAPKTLRDLLTVDTIVAIEEDSCGRRW